MKLGHFLDWLLSQPPNAIAGWLFLILVVSVLAMTVIFRDDAPKSL
jgi:hypothetical protein